MPLKTSYFKKELWKQAFRSFGWIGIGYFLALLFLLPLQIIMVKTKNDPNDINYYRQNIDSLFGLNGEIQGVLFLIIPVLAAVFTSRYMHVKGSADFIHSLPLRRSQLFAHQFLIGYMMILIPVCITACVLFVLSGVMDVAFIYQSNDILNWFYETLTFTTFLYAIAYFVGTLTGMSVVQGGLSFIFIIFPAGISMLINENLNMLLEGFSVHNASFFSFSSNLTPIWWFMELSNKSNLEIANWIYGIYWLISVIFIGISLILYRIRPIESANQTIAFPLLKPIFKFGVTFCFMLLGGVYFGAVQQQSEGWMIFGYICGALFGYLLAKMLIQKTWRVFDQWKGFMIYIGISIVVILSVMFDWYGFEANVPEKGEVEGIYFVEQNTFNNWYGGRLDQKLEQSNITNPELMEKVINLHEYILANDHIGQYQENIYMEKSTDIEIIYHLKNGKRMVRQYFIPSMDEVEEYVKPILESIEYKQSSLDWLNDKNNRISSVTVSGYDYRQQVTDQYTINKITDALKQDYLKTSYEEMTHSRLYGESKYLEFEVESEQTYFYHVPLLNSYSKVLEVLEQEELDRGLTIHSTDVSMVAISNTQKNEEIVYELPHMEKIDRNKWMLVEDSEQIEELVSLNNDVDGTWKIAYYGPSDKNFIEAYQVSEDQLPSFVTDYFE
ncbi:DUF6449 domain-containing protein [Gracilibacillus thailandensis]|uniref:ABC transporter permease n=1 Tax=Gracilibacillus thailandensis TaxID=563735 RepID=A0A6N7QVM8_9BACI|nr:DUF6449 domain-containing protein [Gracilibacillus thailandensis]MRI65594.1 hypothetical protein [Gracilibacillus thailandensis]